MFHAAAVGGEHTGWRFFYGSDGIAVAWTSGRPRVCRATARTPSGRDADLSRTCTAARKLKAHTQAGPESGDEDAIGRSSWSWFADSGVKSVDGRWLVVGMVTQGRERAWNEEEYYGKGVWVGCVTTRRRREREGLGGRRRLPRKGMRRRRRKDEKELVGLGGWGWGSRPT